MKKEVIIDKKIECLRYDEIVKKYDKYIYKILNSYKSSFKKFNNVYNFEDLHQESLLAGYKAFLVYDISKGYEIITIMNTYIRTNLNLIYRRLKEKQKEKTIMYLDDTFNGCGINNDDGSLRDLISNDFSDNLILKINIEQATQNYNEKKLDCVNFLKNNITMTQFSDKYNVSRAYLYKLKNIVVDDLKNKLN